MHHRCRQPLGRMEQRDDRALARITADRAPGEIVVQQDDQRADRRKHQFAMVGQPVAQRGDALGHGQNALLELHRNSQPFARPQQTGGGERGAGIGLVGDRHRLFGRARRAGVADGAIDLGAVRDDKRRGRLLDRKGPVIARRVPEQLIMIGEQPGHPRHGVVNGVGVGARIEEHIGRADANALEPALVGRAAVGRIDV